MSANRSTSVSKTPFLPGECDVRRLVIAAAMMLTASISWAHLPVGKVWPAVQFPDGKTPTIDGNVIEWDIIPSPYWITHENLTETVIGVGTAFDATDMALRAIVGWNDTANKMYMLEDRFDNAIQELERELFRQDVTA